jgi:protein-S-isoprenylcysteine O-methyltransferase Ste14
MEHTFLIAATLFFVCLIIRLVYELLKEAGKIDLENRPLFVVIFLAMCLLWSSWFTLCPADANKLDLPDFIRWGGLAMFILGTILAVGALIQLRGVENIDHLVTGGLFRKIRHPMYTGFILWIVGWGLYHGAATGLSIGLFGVISVLWWRRLEEGRLERQFGGTYMRYRKTSWW